MSTIDANEIKKFADISATWWDYEGPFKQLHNMNRVRVAYIQDILKKQNFICDHSLQGLRILDIGCGGGILSASLSRLGAEVTGLDAANDNISVATHYAAANDLNIKYVTETAEGFATSGNTYDVVCALEIIEHVADVKLFLESVARLTKKDGMIFISTLNKTSKSYLQGILLAEYVLQMVPIGTHDWQKFVEPSTMFENLPDSKLIDMKGIKYRPFTGEWHISDNVDVNYIMAFQKL